MAITVRRLRRLEAWSDWKAAGGTRQAIIDDAKSAVARSSAAGESADTLTVEIPIDSPAAAYLGTGKFIRIDQDDATYDEWKIVARSTDDAAGHIVLTAYPFRVTDLVEAGLVQRVDSDGVIVHDFDSVGLTPSEHITQWVLPALAQAGYTWIAAGTITPTARIDMTFSWDSPLSVLLRLASATQMELDVRRDGDTGYLIDLVPKVNSGAALADLRVEKNLQNVVRGEDALTQATRVYPRGAAQEEFHATMARAVWEVTNVAGDVITLADPAGGAGPILVDDQFASALADTLGEIDAGSRVVDIDLILVLIIHDTVYHDDVDPSSSVQNITLV